VGYRVDGRRILCLDAKNERAKKEAKKIRNKTTQLCRQKRVDMMRSERSAERGEWGDSLGDSRESKGGELT